MGLSGRRASLFRTNAREAPRRLIEWITSNPAALGLRLGIRPKDLGFDLFSVSAHNRLSLIKLSQYYRGLPLLGPESIIVLSGQGDKVNVINGRVIDGSIPYANLLTQVPESTAAAAIRHHAADNSEQVEAIELTGLRLYAVAHSQRIVWAAQTSRKGVPLGLFAVDAAPTAGDELPGLVYTDRRVYPALEEEISIKVMGNDLAQPPYALVPDLPIALNETIATGASLTGSTAPGGIQLGSPRVFVRNLQGKNFDEGVLASTRFLSMNGEFLAASGVEFDAQRWYHLYQSFYDITDRYLSVTGQPALKQWDSYRGDESSFPPGTYQPRIVVFTSSGEKCGDQPACAGVLAIPQQVPTELPEFVHKADENGLNERIGFTHVRTEDVSLDTIAHEFGHVVDGFLFPGLPEPDLCTPGVDCIAKCVENTPDEAEPLREAVAQLLALLYLYEAFDVVNNQDCEAIDWISTNSGYSETPGACMSALGQIAYMVRDGDCPVPDNGFCDKPEQLEYITICCDTDADPECLADSACADKGGGSKLAPTGACNESPGYRSNSTLEAFWQLIIGQACSPDAPFSCLTIDLVGDASPSEVAARALFYALRSNSRTFRQLFDNIAAYYSCEHGAAAFDGVRTVLCNHRIIDCNAQPPMLCGECGDGVVDDGEQCDLAAIPVTCQDLGFSAGEISCNHVCELDTTNCIQAVPTGTGDASTSGTNTSDEGPDAASATSGPSVPGGCACRSSSGPRGLEAPFLFGALGFTLNSRRRRKS